MSLQIKNFAGYALITPSKGQVGVKSLAGYALIAPPPELQKTGNAHDTLVEQIKSAASQSLEGTQLALGNPGVTVGPGETNTSLQVTANGDDVEGVADFFYKRRPLGRIWRSMTPLYLSLAGKARTHDLLPLLIQNTGVQLVAGDIVDEPIVVSNGLVTLKAAASSYFFVAGSTFSFMKELIPAIIDYRLEEQIAVTTVRNSADFSQPGSRLGSNPTPTAGKVGNGWGLNGATSIKTNMKTPAGAVSFAAQVRFSNFTGRQAFLGDGDSTGTIAGGRLHVGISGSNFEVNISNGTTVWADTSIPHGMSINGTYGVGFKVNAAGDRVTFYRDGLPVGSVTPTVVRPASASPNDLHIGQAGAFTGIRLAVNMIDRVKVWNAELSDADFLYEHETTVSANPGVWSATDLQPGGAVQPSADLRSLTFRSYSSGRATKSRNSGRRMFEITDCLTPRFMVLGVGTAAANLAQMPGADANAWAYYANNGNKLANNVSVAYGASWAVNDVLGVAVDFDNGTVTFYKNGVSQGVAFTGLQGKTLFPIAGSGSTGSSSMTALLNYGEDGFAFPIEGYTSW